MRDSRAATALTRRGRRTAGFCLAFALAAQAAAAHADSSAPAPKTGTPTAPPDAPGVFGFLNASASNPNLLGDMGGFRTFLGKYGLTLNLTENAEIFGN